MTVTWKRILSLITVGAAAWVAAALSGQMIVIATGVPASSAVLNGFLVPFLLVLGVRAIGHPWSMTISFTTYGILSIPILLLGPPGAHKVVVALLAGVAADLVLRADSTQTRHWVYALAMVFWAAVQVVLARLAFEIEALDLPGKEAFVEAFPILAAIFIVEGVIGGYVASWLYDARKLDKNRIIQRLHRWIERQNTRPTKRDPQS